MCFLRFALYGRKQAFHSKGANRTVPRGRRMLAHDSPTYQMTNELNKASHCTWNARTYRRRLEALAARATHQNAINDRLPPACPFKLKAYAPPLPSIVLGNTSMRSSFVLRSLSMKKQLDASFFVLLRKLSSERVT